MTPVRNKTSHRKVTPTIFTRDQFVDLNKNLKKFRQRRTRKLFVECRNCYCLMRTTTLSVIAQTTAGGFTSLGSGPSINSYGEIAFQASLNNTQLGKTVDNVFSFSPSTHALTKLMPTQFEQGNSGTTPVQIYRKLLISMIKAMC